MCDAIDKLHVQPLLQCGACITAWCGLDFGGVSLSSQLQRC